MQISFSRRYRVQHYAILLVCALGLSGCERAASPPEPTGEVYKLAYADFQLSDGAYVRDDVLEGVIAANAAEPYLDNGDKLEIVYREGPVSIDGASEQLHIYGEQGGVSALMIGSVSRVVLEIKDEIEALKLPTLAITATHPDIISDTSYLSQLSYDDKKQAGAAALFVRDELLINRAVVVFDETDPHSAFVAQEFRTQFERTGGRIDGFYLVSELDTRILKGLRDSGVPFLYMPFTAAKVLDVLAKLKSVDWSPLRMGADGLLASLVNEFPTRWIELQGMYVTDLYTSSQESINVAAFVKEVAVELMDIYGEEVSSFAALGVEGYRTLKDALNQCPDRNNRECVNQAVRSGKRREGIISSYSIGEDGRAQRPIYINRVVDDHLELVVKVN